MYITCAPSVTAVTNYTCVIRGISRLSAAPWTGPRSSTGARASTAVVCGRSGRRCGVRESDGSPVRRPVPCPRRYRSAATIENSYRVGRLVLHPTDAVADRPTVPMWWPVDRCCSPAVLRRNWPCHEGRLPVPTPEKVVKAVHRPRSSQLARAADSPSCGGHHRQCHVTDPPREARRRQVPARWAGGLTR